MPPERPVPVRRLLGAGLDVDRALASFPPPERILWAAPVSFALHDDDHCRYRKRAIGHELDGEGRGTLTALAEFRSVM